MSMKKVAINTLIQNEILNFVCDEVITYFLYDTWLGDI